MATYPVPVTITTTQMLRLASLIERYLGESAATFRPGDGTVEVNGLTPQEEATLADLILLCRSPLEWSPSDYAVFKTERPTLAAFLGLSAPTNNQRDAAIKSIIRVLNAIVRTG